jgi:hypothetical protein
MARLRFWASLRSAGFRDRLSRSLARGSAQQPARTRCSLTAPPQPSQPRVPLRLRLPFLQERLRPDLGDHEREQRHFGYKFYRPANVLGSANGESCFVVDPANNTVQDTQPPQLANRESPCRPRRARSSASALSQRTDTGLVGCSSASTLLTAARTTSGLSTWIKCPESGTSWS